MFIELLMRFEVHVELPLQVPLTNNIIMRMEVDVCIYESRKHDLFHITVHISMYLLLMGAAFAVV